MGNRVSSCILFTSLFASLTLFPAGALPAAGKMPQAADVPVTFAVIGDYGVDNADELAVANLVASWNPSFVIATGDDYYSAAGGTGTARYDESTGAYYCNWLKDISTTGTRCPTGKAAVNAFFPALGNHDYSDATPALETYLAYFTLPGAGYVNTSGNERYYDFVTGPVHFFVLNSNSQEPDGTSDISIQAQWLEQQLATSTSSWNIVYDHHPPYSSDSSHGSTVSMRWPFAAWGADVVVSGHAHTYERILRDGIVYFVNGLGGAARYGFTSPVAGSAFRYNASWGAQKVTASATTLDLEFYNVNGELVDSYRLGTLAPTTQTSPATSITAVGATLNGAVSSNGAETTVLFEYGRTAGYGSAANAVQGPLPPAASHAAVSVAITGLACGTPYHFRVVAANSVGSANGDDATFTTAACDQIITFGAAPVIAVGSMGTVGATASSGLPVTFTTTTPSACTIAGSTVTGITVGTCRIAANQAGDSSHNPAMQVTQSFGIRKGSQAAFTGAATPSSLVYSGIAALSTTGGSGTGAVAYVITAGPCSITGSTLTAIGVGTCTVTATKAGDSNYNAITAVVSVPVSKAIQTITFGNAPGVAVGGTGPVMATATSGLAVAFSSFTPSICTVAGSSITGLASGACTVAAEQAGNANYNPASQVTQTFSIQPPAMRVLTIKAIGDGIGTVTSNPPGVNCVGDCAATYASGTIVQLTAATPHAGSAFSGWGGSCAGAVACTLGMSGDTSVTANFVYTGSTHSYGYVQKAYVAYYGRPGDSGGMAYWAGRMDAEGGSLDSIIDAFANSAEFDSRYGGLDDSSLINGVYRQVLGRNADADGLAFYLGELSSGRRTLQSIALDILNGAVLARDSTIVANKLEVAAYYTGKVAAGCPYGSATDGVNAVSGATETYATVVAAKAAIDSRCGM